jgi:ABC-2 type transport system ATP-binding protein
MLQRTGIAQALVHDPSVVFLDEPMSGLDPIGRKEVRDLILRLRDEGKTVFMNTHILSDVEMVCDRVAILVQGRIRYQGRIEGFLEEGEEQVDVVLSGLSLDAAERLETKFGVDLRGLGDRIEFQVPSKLVTDVIQDAAARGAEVRSVTPSRVSLESIFMSAVQGGPAGREEGS